MGSLRDVRVNSGDFGEILNNSGNSGGPWGNWEIIQRSLREIYDNFEQKRRNLEEFWGNKVEIKGN